MMNYLYFYTLKSLIDNVFITLFNMKLFRPLILACIKLMTERIILIF